MTDGDLEAELRRLREENAALNEQVKLLVQTEQRLYRAQNDQDAQLDRIRALAGFSLVTSHLESSGAIVSRGLHVIASTFSAEWIGAIRLEPDRTSVTVLGSTENADDANRRLALGGDAWRGLAEYAAPEFVRRTPEDPLPPPFALLHAIDPGLLPAADSRHPGECAVVPLSLAEDGSLRGVLVVLTTKPRPVFVRDGAVAESHLPFLQLVARHLEHALANAHLTESLSERSAALARSLESLERTQQQLLQSQKMEAVGRLAGGVAHDFNNLLTVVLGYAGGLTTMLPKGSPGHEYSRQIVDAAKRAAGITSQLLALGKRQMQRPEDLDLSTHVRRTAELLRRLVGEHIRLELELREALPAVRADRSQLEQVMLNLIVNARDAMPDGGLLRLVTRAATRHDAELCSEALDPARFAVLEVHDQGVGMDDAVRSRIFEPFFTTKPAGQGTGLGLSVVYGIVNQSGGHVLVRSAPGEGSTFTVLLPVASGALLAPAPAPGAVVTNGAAQPAGPRPVVLVVEDESAIRGVVQATLEQAGFLVRLANDGVEALLLIEGHGTNPDLVLTDVVMPRMGGIRLAEQLAERRLPVRVAFMSGYAENFATPTAGDHKPPFLAKPFSTDELVAFVHAQLAVPAPVAS